MKPTKRDTPGRKGHLSIDDLSVVVDAPPPWSNEDLADRMLLLAHREAPRRERGESEIIGAEDDVTVNIVGFVDGKLLPFSVQPALLLRLSLGDEGLPGLPEALVGAKVGSTVQLPFVVAADFPIASFRGHPGVAMVEILSAEEVILPDLDDPTELKRMGYASPGDMVERAALELNEEAKALVSVEALWAVLDLLVNRAKAKVSRPAVDDAIAKQWQRHEGGLLDDLGISQRDRDRARKAWLADASLREDITKRFARTAVLVAIGKQEKIPFGSDDPDAGARLARLLKLPAMQAAALLRDPQTAAAARDLSAYMRVVEHVLSRANIEMRQPAAD